MKYSNKAKRWHDIDVSPASFLGQFVVKILDLEFGFCLSLDLIALWSGLKPVGLLFEYGG